MFIILRMPWAGKKIIKAIDIDWEEDRVDTEIVGDEEIY